MESSNDSNKSIDVNSMTMEELVLWLQQNPYDEVALNRLFDEMKEAVKTIMYNFYPAFLPYYDIDDMYQEAHLAMWKALKNYKCERGWKAKSFMELVVKRRFIRVHEIYYSKNPYNLYVTDDETSEEGLVKGKAVESGFRKRNLEKKREYNNKWRVKNGLSPSKPRVKLTPEEKLQKEIERKRKQKAYYEANKEKIKERWHNASPEVKAERSRKRKEYYRQNRERALMLAKLYKINHPEKAEESKRRYYEKQKRLREEQKRQAAQDDKEVSISM